MHHSSRQGAGRLRPPCSRVCPQTREQLLNTPQRGPRIILHPGSGGSSRDWPSERFGALGARLAEAHGVQVIVTGAASDRFAVERAKQALGPAAVELKKVLESESLKGLLETIEVQGEVRPLSEEESRLYISHRLQKADSEVHRVFTPDALDMICQYGQGNPRRLNILCDNSFLIGYGLSKKMIDSAIVAEVLEDLDFVGEEERNAWKSEEALKPKTLAHRLKSPLFRKLAYSLLALGGVGAIILLGRMFLKGPEDSVSP